MFIYLFGFVGRVEMLDVQDGDAELRYHQMHAL